MRDEKYYGWKLISIWAAVIGGSWALALMVVYAIAWVLQ